MKLSAANIFSLVILAIGTAWALAGFIPPRGGGFDLNALGRVPVEFGTRVVPLDSVARDTLRLFSGRTSVRVSEDVRLQALPWLLDVAFRRGDSERLPVFRIDHDEVLALLGRVQPGQKYFSLAELEPRFHEIEQAAQRADEKQRMEQPLSLFEDKVQTLRNNLVLCQRLSMSFAPAGTRPAAELDAWESLLPPGKAAFLAREQGRAHDETVLGNFAAFAQRFRTLEGMATVGLIPQTDGHWQNLGQSALDALRTDTLSPVLHDYARLAEAWRGGDKAAFNAAVAALAADLGPAADSPRVRLESVLDRVEPFYRGMILYILAFLCVCAGWLFWGPELRRAAMGLIALGFALQTAGLIARTYLTGFGIVTNLYSSALFVGWVAVFAGMVIEVWKKDGLGAAEAAFTGFATLLVAHNLPFTGDDLELPRAVLATNFWLWTHVKIITFGYGAMFVAGSLASGYILAGSLTPRLGDARAREIAALVYGVMCFATLFSFVGTMLGGIWADQSWGRFWGWDPKENGALLIVLWCAIFLHARWGKLCSERTLMALAVGGNIVTAWSWFGTNLLGVGLHSYGFMHGTFLSLVAFWISQLGIIVIAMLPRAQWRSPVGAAGGAA